MKASTTLIQALRRAADGIDTNSMYYSWGSPESCNCGIVAQCLLGLSQLQLAAKLETGNSWSLRCSHTGLSMNVVVQQLFGLGFAVEDLCDLEFLRCDAIRQKAGLGPKEHRDERIGHNVTAYLRAWATLLEEQLQQEQAAEKKQLNPITSALAKSAPCAHLFLAMGDSCVLCGYIKPATSPVQVGGGE